MYHFICCNLSHRVIIHNQFYPLFIMVVFISEFLLLRTEPVLSSIENLKGMQGKYTSDKSGNNVFYIYICEIIHGSHNMLWVLTWVGMILVFYPKVIFDRKWINYFLISWNLGTSFILYRIYSIIILIISSWQACHATAEILLKLALNTNQSINTSRHSIW